MPENYQDINRELWNKKVEPHVASEFYDNESFLRGNSTLNSIELELLGNIEGKSVLHLQCHFGQDTISMSRMGASATGVDLSDKAIEKAKQFAEQTEQDCRFICCDVYDLKQHLDKKFDIVFTSYGTIGWLPDMQKWADIVTHFLAPNGRLVFAEFHPVVWMFDDDFKTIKYNYANNGPIVETEEGTYADVNADIKQECITWNHSMSEVIGSLLEKGLTIEQLKEYDYSPYDCFNQTEEFEKGKFRIQHLGDKIPMVYSIVARK